MVTIVLKGKPPLVLLHGGRHGGWCWARTAPLLREAGYEVHTPTLTGLGDRAHLLQPDVGLSTHIRDLVALFECEELENAVVVPHSYGGVVASGAMEHIHDRVRRLVFLDAIVPQTGESVFDLIGPELAATIQQTADRDGDGWYIPPSDAAFYGVTEPDDIAWVNRRTTAQPLKTYTDRVGSTERAWAHPTTFIECEPSTIRPELLARLLERSTRDEQFSYEVIRAPHDMMVTAPQRTARLLLDAIQQA
jgi:pimeloyl-ACP methyl ester carboxylesterase